MVIIIFVVIPQMVYFGNVTENGTQGMVVMTMTAEDYDDANEGTNAKLTYSIEKNVIDENTATPIFEIEPDTGVIKTAVCCLDREKTPDYSIQVVAVDGGGLKGNYYISTVSILKAIVRDFLMKANAEFPIFSSIICLFFLISKKLPQI